MKLFEIGANHIIKRSRVSRIEMIGADTGENLARPVSGVIEGPADELVRGCPIKAHAPLRRVHGFGNAQTLVEQISAVGQGFLPVECGCARRVGVGERVRHHMGRGEGDAIEGRLRLPDGQGIANERVVTFASGCGQADLHLNTSLSSIRRRRAPPARLCRAGAPPPW